MTPRIEVLAKKKLVGMQMRMSLAENKMGMLWGGFMPRRKEIENVIGSDLYSMVVYDKGYFENFSFTNIFTRVAAVEVSEFGSIPDKMEAIVLAEGLYAVFEYKGMSNDPAIFNYIYSTWLPSSEYVLDDRPHFEVLGERYKNNDPSSEEEIWIPVKLKH